MKKTLWLPLIGGIVLVLVAAILVSQRGQQTRDESCEGPAACSLVAIRDELNVQAPINPLPYWPQWIEASGQRVPLKSSDLVLGTIQNEYVGKITDQPHEQIDRAYLKSISPRVDDAFAKNGFVSNEANSHPEGQGINALVAAYEKEEVKCIAEYLEHSDPFLIILCGVYDPEQAAWQRELVPVINPANDPELIISVTKIQGDYATGQANSRGGGGHYWLAVKENGTWKSVFAGQDVVPCTTVDQHSIPREIYENCFDEKTQNVRFPIQ